MKSLLSLLLLAGAISAQPKPSPLKGVWRLAEYIKSGSDAATYPAQPGIYIFTDKYFSIVAISGDKPRPEVDPSKGTDVEILASWKPLVAQSGTYEISGTTVTMAPAVAKQTNRMGPDHKWTLTYQLDGDTLLITETRTPTFKMKFTRLE
jgi:hypothetical protein